MSAANPNPMEKSMVSVLVVANAGGGSPLPLLFVVIAAYLLSALSFLLFFCEAFPSTVFHLPLSTGAVVVGVSGRVMS
jgi:hypothetical protein